MTLSGNSGILGPSGFSFFPLLGHSLPDSKYRLNDTTFQRLVMDGRKKALEFHLLHFISLTAFYFFSKTWSVLRWSQHPEASGSPDPHHLKSNTSHEPWHIFTQLQLCICSSRDSLISFKGSHCYEMMFFCCVRWASLKSLPQQESAEMCRIENRRQGKNCIFTVTVYSALGI